MGGWEPNPQRGILGTKYQWHCWYESCSYCEAFEGKIFYYDQWYAAGVMPGLHAYCDCTLAEVSGDTPTSDPDIFGGNLDLMMRDGRFCFFDCNYRSYPMSFLDAILAATPPGGTIKDAWNMLKAQHEGRHGILFPAAKTRWSWFNKAWNWFDWGSAPWRSLNTFNYYRGINGFGSY